MRYIPRRCQFGLSAAWFSMLQYFLQSCEYQWGAHRDSKEVDLLKAILV